MSTRNAQAVWNGTLKEGKGEMKFSNYTGPFTFASRFEEGEGTNPEELVGAAIAGCYSMFLSALISGEDLTPQSIETTATVNLEKDDIGPNITNINLICNVDCEGLTQEKFDELTLAAKEKCPISRLYAGGTAKIELDAKLALVKN
ncbi:MAG: OsmC family peroxiredoxin [Ignavibacteria bacterium]|nr:OsmC family peroxiredoxin [Ignavibacteria bacterium]